MDEAGIANLTNDDTPMLIGYDVHWTDSWTLVRFEQPKVLVQK